MSGNYGERAERAIQQAQRGRKPDDYAVTTGLTALVCAVLHLAEELEHTREQVLAQIDRRRT